MECLSELNIRLSYQYDNQLVNFRGISTPSYNVAWVSGSHGCILKTINHGKDWESFQIPDNTTSDFRDIKGFEENIAYVMSSGGNGLSSIYKTMDGGQSWQLKLKGANFEFFNAMAFWSPSRGIVLGDPVNGKFRLYVTETGGKLWTQVSDDNMPDALENEGAFAASGSSITTYGEMDAWFATGGNTARVFHTRDGGKSWKVVSTPITQETLTSGIFSISFCDANHGVIAGGDYKNPEKGGSNLAFTSNGGVSWEIANVSPQYYYSAVSYSQDTKHILVAGNSQVALTTNEPSKDWEKSSFIKGINAFSFWSKECALAVGEKGVIVEMEALTM